VWLAGVQRLEEVRIGVRQTWSRPADQLPMKRREQYARRKQRRQLMNAPARCPACGEVFKPPRKDSRYCSSACRQRDDRQRRGESLRVLKTSASGRDEAVTDRAPA
jgi:hypothetical protein